MGVRRYTRDRRGRFSSSGAGTIGRVKPDAAPSSSGSLTRKLRAGQRKLYRAEQDRMQALGGTVAGMRIIRRNVRQGATRPAASTGQRNSGRVADALRGTMRQLAQSDARYFRQADNILSSGRGGKGTLSGSTRKPQRRLKGS